MNQEKSDNLLLAIASAYVWVASSDHGVGVAEATKYEHSIVESQFATQFNNGNIHTYFKDMVGVFNDNYEEAINLTKKRIQQFIDDPHCAEEIVRMSRAALISDGHLYEAEENVLHEITSVLKIKDL